MELVYDYPGQRPRFPYLVIQDGAASFYKVLLRNRFLYVSHGEKVIDRGGGELDIPFVGAARKPIGDFVYESPAAARAAYERFRAAPREALAIVQAGRKP